MDLALVIPSFIAGLLTFFAPCTLPLVPGFLAFISGVSPEELSKDKEEISEEARKRIFWNGVWYVLGFSSIFITLGVLFGLTGATLVGYQLWLTRIGGVVVIFFGLYLMGLLKFKMFNFMNSEKRFHVNKLLKPGRPMSSFVFGSTFALGWSPCIGPILGSILLLTWSSGTIAQGAFLLFVFSLGLAIPFLILAATISTASKRLKKINKYLPIISKIGGVFLVFLGALLLSDKLSVWTGIAFKWLSFVNYDKILDYL